MRIQKILLKFSRLASGPFSLFFLVLLLYAIPGFGTTADDFSSSPVDRREVQMTPAELLSAYVQIPSVSGEEKEAGEFLAAFCKRNGLHVHVFTDAPDSYNFAASLYPLDRGKPNIVFLTHIDVVPAGDPDGWTHPPFSGRIADGMVWGRGSIDNKAMGVMQVMAILEFLEQASQEDLPYNVSLLAVSGEETGGDMGARIIADRYLDILNPLVVYGEGGAGITGLSPAFPEMPVFGLGVTQKRRMFLAIESRVAASGHGSVPRKQYSTREVVGASAALLEAVPRVSVSPVVREALLALSEYETGIIHHVLQRVGFYGPLFGRVVRGDPLIASMLTNTMSLTSLSSEEGAYNQIPGYARAVFDCRLLPETDQEEFLAQIRRIVAPYNVTVTVLESSPYTPASEQGEFYMALEESIRHVFGDVLVVPFMFVAINDNRFFRRHGIPAYGLLPAVMPEELMESIHHFDERFPVNALDKGIAVYVHLVRTILDSVAQEREEGDP